MPIVSIGTPIGPADSAADTVVVAVDSVPLAHNSSELATRLEPAGAGNLEDAHADDVAPRPIRPQERVRAMSALEPGASSRAGG